jgi:hypothetical protein
MGIINLLTCNSAGHLRPFGTEGSLTQPSLAAQRRRLVGKCVGTYGSRSKGIADEILNPLGRPPLRAQEETRSLVGAWRRIAVVVALGAALFESDNAQALDVGEIAPAPSLQWCLLQRDGSSDHPACYENMLACVLAAFAHATSCTQRPNLIAAATEPLTPRAAAPVRPARRQARNSPLQHKFTAAERNELYRKFQEWQERSTHE